MTNYCIRQLKGYFGHVMILYTLLVTFFLLQTAWDDANKKLHKHKRSSDVKILDVLVREEHRHLRNFQNVVQNYRGELQMDTRNRASSQQYLQFEQMGRSLNDTGKKMVALPSARHEENDLYKGEPPTMANESLFVDDSETMPEMYEKLKANRPTYKVEVEEWDENVVRHKSEMKQSSPHVQTFARVTEESANVRVSRSSDSAARSTGHLGKVVYKDLTYSTEFCDDVFQEKSDTEPAICKRELADTSSKQHVSISTTSLHFRKFGDIDIYSAFLDTRGTSFVVRLLTLAAQGLNNRKSIYWCAFLSAKSALKTKARLNTTADTSPGKDPIRLTSQLTYYAASDGHKQSSQFYIMSCQVPEEAQVQLVSPQGRLLHIVTGTTERPFLGSVQVSIIIRIIVNSLGELHTKMTDTSPQRGLYFAKMEEDLLSLNVPGIQSKEPSTHNSTNSVIFSDLKPNSGVQGGKASPRLEDRIVACVAPLQGKVGLVQIMEFIELTLLLGSQHIVFYKFQVSDGVSRVLQMYQTRGLVTVLPWNLSSSSTVWAMGRDFALNDCLYRSMHLYDYGLFLDLDEFFVPRITPDLPSFLKYLKTVHRFNSTTISDIVFSSAYFPPPSKGQFQNLTSIPGFTKDVSKFISLKSVQRSHFNPQHALRLVKLIKAYRVGPGERRKTSFTISPRFATVNHFSFCPQEVSAGQGRSSLANEASRNVVNGPNKSSYGQQEDSRKAEISKKESVNLCNHTKLDWVMWRYKSKLIERTKQNIRLLNGGG